jgi:hypothetical protein
VGFMGGGDGVWRWLCDPMVGICWRLKEGCIGDGCGVKRHQCWCQGRGLLEGVVGTKEGRVRIGFMGMWMVRI